MVNVTKQSVGPTDDIGLDLVARLEASVKDQVQKGIALKIRTKVLDARNDPDTSSRRWPFELIQNAHDAGARAGREKISLSFRLNDDVLHFEHDAAPFTMEEFAALLTGGSSKDFMSPDTTGRFGTGFLVTHVLSERVRGHRSPSCSRDRIRASSSMRMTRRRARSYSARHASSVARGSCRSGSARFIAGAGRRFGSRSKIRMRQRLSAVVGYFE
jgi:hypothetical protein